MSSSLWGGQEEEKGSEGGLQSYVDKASESMKKLGEESAALLGYREKTQLEVMEEQVCACCPTMTYSQRIAGYCFCLFISFLLTIGAATRLSDLLAGNPGPFAIFYTAENVVAVSSTFFLSGPYNQLKRMCDNTRYMATLIYFFSMFATLFFVFYTAGIPPAATVALIFLFIFVQWCAVIWYTLSYIPFVRDYIASCCCECCKDACCSCCDSKSDTSD